MRILGFLNGGVSIAETAAREVVTGRGMHAQICPRPFSPAARRSRPEEFMALQIIRLHEALLEWPIIHC